MRLYSARPARRAVQLTSDLLTLAWVACWWLASTATRAAVLVLAEPARATADAARRVRDSLGEAATAAGQVPGVGPGIRRPLDGASAGVGDILSAAAAQVTAIENLALLVAVVVFAVPVLTWLALWLPRRLRFVRNASAAARFVDSGADLDLFALRAMATLPLTTLARVSDDPVKAWREGDRAVIDELAGLALDDEGLPRPPQLGSQATSSTARPDRPSDGPTSTL